MKSSSPASAHCRSSKTMTRCPARRSARRTSAMRRRARRLRRSGARRGRAGRPAAARSSAARPRRGRAVPASGELRARDVRVVGLGDPGAHPDHLAERPERDAVAVGRAAAVVPPDRLGQSVDVLLQLPRQPRLPDAADARHRDDSRPCLSRPVACRSSLSSRSSSVAPDERRLDRHPVLTPRARPRPGAPARRRPAASLPFNVSVPAALERDRAGRRPVGRLADKHPAGLGGGLES